MFSDLFFRHPLISASILASFGKSFLFRHQILHAFFHNFFIASVACFCQCPPVSCTKIIASTARISRCRRSPRTTIRRHRPVSGVLNKRSQMAKRRLRRLALLTPRGPTFGTFVAHFGVIFGIRFLYYFWHAFFPVILAFLTDFGSHFGSLLASFCILFACLFLASILHRFYMDFS